MNFYTQILRPLMFCLPPEAAHNFAIRAFSLVPPSILRSVFGATPRCEREVFGVKFPNPIGLAAGMDKNAECLLAWEALGFGFVEIGTITAKPQPGNPKPRVFRYPSQAALINRMGFNNDGAEAVAARLEKLRASGRWPTIPVGVNIGKSKVTPLDEAAEDYRFSARTLRKFANYFVINVSSPNTPGLRELQDAKQLQAIAEAVVSEAKGIPVLVKIAPDLADEAAVEVASLAAAWGLAGMIVNNTTLDHSSVISAGERDEQGGLSGRPLASRSTALLRKVISATKLPVVASGGVMDATTSQEKWVAGAQLLEVYTGFIYEGPDLLRKVLP